MTQPGTERPGDQVRSLALPAEHTTARAVGDLKLGRTISVCIPCRNEEATVGPIVTSIRRSLDDVVDEVLVVDDGSVDETATVARAAGAVVLPIELVNERHGDGAGKGNALWASLLASRGDVVVWCDADLTSFDPSWVCRLAQPLLADDDVALVKARAARPTDRGGGGRTTELVARPLLSRFFPGLAELAQPLAGEYAGRRDVLEGIPFVEGWGVEIAMLIDIARLHGIGSIAEVDVGQRIHRHSDLHALSVQAAEVMSTVLDRAGIDAGAGAELLRPGGPAQPLNLRERPPVSTLERTALLVP